MSWYITEEENNQMETSIKNRETVNFSSKPIVIYSFVNLTCHKCWKLEPYLKKLLLEYGKFFTVRPVISHNTLHLIKQNSSKNKHGDHRNAVSNPLISVKAAGLQGNRAGRSFLRNIQQAFFIKKQNIYDIDTIMDCAKRSQLDLAEFKSDLNSLTAHNAFQCDIKIANEMDVNQLPTLVFFSQIVEEHSFKVSGIQTYDTYVFMLKEMLKKNPKPTKKPSIEKFLQYYKVVEVNEIAIIYDLTVEEAILKLKELQLMQKAKQVEHNNHHIWCYTED